MKIKRPRYLQGDIYKPVHDAARRYAKTVDYPVNSEPFELHLAAFGYRLIRNDRRRRAGT